jgi:DNA-directed RNA polymerase specialized sigma24 family protein
MLVRTIFKIFLRYLRVPLSSYSDARLLKWIRKNDQEAFEVVFERYWAPLFDFIFSRVQSVDVAQEIVQDVFTSLWLKRKLLSQNNLRSYLYSDANTRSVEYLAERLANSLESGVTSIKLVDGNQSEYNSCHLDLYNSSSNSSMPP